MSESDKNEIYLSSSPHFRGTISVERLMYSVVIALLPICVEGVILYGLHALAMILISAATCVLSEFVFNKITRKHRNTIFDGSAIITGILLALTLPPTVPFWILILGDVFAIIVVKSIFGGLGQNVWNPALAGRAFLMISFPSVIGSGWIDPKVDVTTSATMLAQSTHPFQFGDFSKIFEYKNCYGDYFLGVRAGCIGESSAMLILIAAVFLILFRVIDWRIPVSFVGTVALCTLLSGGDVVISILSGGLLFGAVFMATDYATSPMTRPGRLIFGAGCGLITFLIRQFGGYPEGVMFSILFMNCLYPFLNKIISRKYGY